MLRALSLVSSLAVVASLACVTACSSSSATPSEDAGPPGPVSFKTQILPIFQLSCGIAGSTCHGTMGGGQQGLYLAEQAANMDGLGDPTAILAGIVGVASKEDPTMNIITAGDLTKSFLMYKVNNTQGTLTSQCVAGVSGVSQPCGVWMPQTGGGIGAADVTLIQNWIMQGAQNN